MTSVEATDVWVVAVSALPDRGCLGAGDRSVDEGGEHVNIETLTKNGASATPAAGVTPEEELREWARSHVQRVHRLKRDIAAYVLGMVLLTAAWVLVEWQDNGAFKRLSDNGNPGDWEPWILYVALVWGLFLGIDVVRTYFDRPTTEADIERELRRLRPRG